MERYFANTLYPAAHFVDKPPGFCYYVPVSVSATGNDNRHIITTR